MATTAGIYKQMPVYDSAAPRIPIISTMVEVFRYRYLVGNLISRDLKVRYKRSVLGFLWVMLSPLLTMLVLAVVFGAILGVRTPHYVTFVLVGILLMNLFSQGSTAAMSSLVGNGALLRKMYVPPAVFVASTVGSALVNFVFALGPCVVIAFIDGATPKLTWFFIIVPLVETAVLTLGVGLIVACLMVFFHDIFEIYQVLINAYIYATPVMYPTSILPEPMQRFERFNPMALTLGQFRDALIAGQLPALSDVVLAAGIAVVVFAIGAYLFSRVEQRFVYYV